jgi:putative sterol carrier protein
VPETASTPRDFFAELPSKIDAERIRGAHASYRFDVDGAGSWRVDVEDGRVNVTETDADADCVIKMSQATFMRIVRREQSPAVAYMTGTVKVEGDTGLALRLRDFFDEV